MPEMQEKNRTYLVRHWRGELSLPVSYWVNGILANIVAVICTLLIAGTLGSTPSGYAYLAYWLSTFAFLTLIVIWQSVGIWRSADRYSKENSRWFWPAVAKFMVIIGVLNLLVEYNKTLIPAVHESLETAEWLSSIKWDIKVLNEGREVELSGGIKEGISEEFLAALNAVNTIEVVHVNLYKGGLVNEAMELMEIINELGLATYVSGECVSACTIVFLGGEVRLINQHAKLGFHTYSIPGVKDNQMNQSEHKSYLRSRGISNSFITKIFSTPRDQMWYPTTDELLQANVVHQVVGGDEFALPDSPSTGIARLNKKIDRLLNATTVEESVEKIEEFNDQARVGFEIIAKRAKSPASLEFFKLTRKQNLLADKGALMLAKLGEDSKFFDTADFETTDENEQININNRYENFCNYSLY